MEVKNIFNKLIENKEIHKAALRISMSLIFLYFGYIQVRSPDDWTGLIPDFLVSSYITANNIVVINGIFELVFGIFLLIGIYTRLASFLLAIHLASIVIDLGFNPIGVRDFGLAIATFVVFLNGYDKYCFGNYKKE